MAQGAPAATEFARRLAASAAGEVLAYVAVARRARAALRAWRRPQDTNARPLSGPGGSW